MHYTISSFAKMQGLTVDTIRQYERKKIIVPKKNKINNYRYFNDYDVRGVSTCKFYSSLGFSLSQASEMIGDMPSCELSAQFVKQAHCVEKHLEFEHAKLNRLNMFIECFKYIPDKINCYTTVRFPDLVRIVHSDNGILSLNEETTAEVKQWINLLPVTFYTRWINSKIMRSDLEPFKIEMALTTDVKSAKELGLKLSKNTVVAKASDYIFTVIKKPDLEPMDHCHFNPVKRYLSENNLELSGDSFLIYLASDIVNGDKYNYHGVFLPINTK